jgi:flagellar motor switch/type III secretory pathway protein FliN
MQAELAVRFRKSVVPRAPHEHQLRPLSEALEHQPISLSAFLGRCGLSLSEVEGLAEGDVLVLDRATDAPIDLVVDRHLEPNLCRLEKNGEAYQLKILQLRTNSVEP